MCGEGGRESVREEGREGGGRAKFKEGDRRVVREENCLERETEGGKKSTVELLCCLLVKETCERRPYFRG